MLPQQQALSCIGGGKPSNRGSRYLLLNEDGTYRGDDAAIFIDKRSTETTIPYQGTHEQSLRVGGKS
eukprot:scaffold5693_cov141-Skeletonema_menzelii.AAC.11